MQNSHSAPPAGGGYEKSDATARPLLKFGAILAAVIIGVAALMAVTFKYFSSAQSLGQPSAPFVFGRPLPPEPRLQPDPRVDLERLRKNEDAVIRNYDWVNPSAGVIRIPVDRAMDRLLEKGLPVQKEETEKK